MLKCGNDINKEFVVQPIVGDVNVISACTTVYTNKVISCSGDTEIHLTSGTTFFNNNLEPLEDNVIFIGSKVRRFRELNTVSGFSSVFSATSVTYTPILDLGFDNTNELRQITANNSIIQDDTLNGGTY